LIFSVRVQDKRFANNKNLRNSKMMKKLFRKEAIVAQPDEDESQADTSGSADVSGTADPNTESNANADPSSLDADLARLEAEAGPAPVPTATKKKGGFPMLFKKKGAAPSGGPGGPGYNEPPPPVVVDPSVPSQSDEADAQMMAILGLAPEKTETGGDGTGSMDPMLDSQQENNDVTSTELSSGLQNEIDKGDDIANAIAAGSEIVGADGDKSLSAVILEPDLTADDLASTAYGIPHPSTMQQQPVVDPYASSMPAPLYNPMGMAQNPYMPVMNPYMQSNPYGTEMDQGFGAEGWSTSGPRHAASPPVIMESSAPRSSFGTASPGTRTPATATSSSLSVEAESRIGREAIDTALKLDEAGEIDAAMQQYMIATEHLMQAIKKLSNLQTSNAKEQQIKLRKLATNALDRVEALKEIKIQNKFKEDTSLDRLAKMNINSQPPAAPTGTTHAPSQHSSGAGTCAFCLTTTADVVLGCQHQLCKSCYQRAVGVLNKCPDCRTRIVPEQAKWFAK